MKGSKRIIKKGIVLNILFLLSQFLCLAHNEDDLPNILWITCEDISPHLGAYGDPDAKTPTLDRLASEGIIFTNAYANSSVCTPTRSTLISGILACSMGSQHLRGNVRLAEQIKLLPHYLRGKGYYCSNNAKEDYNFKTPNGTWDESSKNAHWRNRVGDQPFFSVFNYIDTHQGQIRYDREELLKRNQELPKYLRHDPSNVVIPPYYPDTEEVRNNLAALHTQITILDQKVEHLLDELKKDGLYDETIIFFFSDHGDGLPRGKRWLHETGTKIPFIVRIPEKYRDRFKDFQGSSDQMISTLDLAPTILNIAEISPPEYMMGQDFLKEVKTDSLVFLFNDRIAQVIDLSRSLRSPRFQYIRNYYPYRPQMQYCDYSEITPIRVELRRLYAKDSLNEKTEWLMKQTKDPEELYDLALDPFQMNNLAYSPGYSLLLNGFRKALYERILQHNDLSFLPEGEMISRSNDQPPYSKLSDDNIYPIDKIVSVANTVGFPTIETEIRKNLGSNDPAIKYWSIVSLIAEKENLSSYIIELDSLLSDPNPNVRIISAEALCAAGMPDRALDILLNELSSDDPRIVMYASYTLDNIGDMVLPAMDEIRALYPGIKISGELSNYPIRPLMHILNKVNE